MDENSILQALLGIASYFADKRARDVTFADADEYEYKIFLLANKWEKIAPHLLFREAFPIMQELWETLGSWDYGEEKDLDRNAKIIALSNKFLQENRNGKKGV